MAELEEFPFPLEPRGCVFSETYRRRLREDPFGEVRMPSGDVARLVVRYADATLVRSDPRFTRDLNYPGAPQMYSGVNITVDPDILPSMPAERHARMRRMLADLFAPSRIAGWRPLVQRLLDELFDGLPDAEVDLVSQVVQPFAIRVMCELMGVPGIDVGQVQEWVNQIMPTTAPELEKQLATMQEAGAYFAALIDRLRQTGGDGVLNSMIHARDEQGNGLTEAELVKNAIALVTAGQASTSAVLGRGLLRLLEPRSYYEQLVAHPELIPNAVEELLRIESPGDGATLRVATEDVELPSGLIRKGEALIASTVGPNNDSAIHPDPEELRLDRERPVHVTFGWGPHYCLGAPLARMELQEFLAALVARFPDLALAEAADDVEWTTATALKSPASLLVRFAPAGRQLVM